MRILAVNPGSTSLKVALVVDGETNRSESVPADDGAAALADLVEQWDPVDAAGVRFVHGGARHLAPVRLDDRVLAELDEVADLAPLHDPPAAAAARALLAQHPDRPVIACFDTTYHAYLPPAAATYALPAEWNRRWQLRRYGFHGLSHQYAARQAAERAGRTEGLRVVSCHLGGGASVCASIGGRSVDTTMGFTPLEGLVMATRSGSVDPGLLLWLLRQGVDPADLEETLDQRSGLAGLSGVSGDLREVSAAAERGSPDAELALGVYRHRLVREVGAMVAAAGGLDVLVLTGGVGENSTWVRDELTRHLTFLDPFEVFVVEAREELMIDEAIRHLLAATA